MKKWLDNFGKADNANESNVSLSEDFVGLAYDTSGRNYSPAWKGQFQQGGSIPGSVGFTYARTAGAAPSEGKYAKKTLPSAQKGKSLQQKRYDEMYGPVESKIFQSIDAMGSDSFYNLPSSTQNFLQSTISGYSDQSKRNIPPTDPIIKEVQQKIKELPEEELGKLLKTDWSKMGMVGAMKNTPSNVGYLDMLKYINHFNKLKKEGYTLQNGGEMKFYQEGLDWKPKSMQRGGNAIDDYIAYPLLKGTAKAMDYVGDKANDALQYFADLQKTHFYTTYPAGTAKVHRKVNDWLFNNVRPVEYPGILNGIRNVGMGLLNMNDPPEKDSLGLYNIGDEAWQKSLVKTKQPMQSHYIIPSKHRPSDAKDPNTTYYTLKEGVINPQLLIDEANRRSLKVGQSAAMTSLAPFIREGFMPEEEFSQIDPIQKFKLSKGKDEKGEYVSIYDKYDFKGPLNSIITPYEWYDRFYINQPKSKLVPSSPKKKERGGIIKDNEGYLNPDNWGKMVEIDQSRPDSFVDMTDVYEPLLAVSNKGEERIMYPGEKHKFKGSKVTEIPLAKLGINQLDAQPKKKLNQLLNFTNNPDKTNWLDKYQ